jgi:hypothetical protein
MVQNSGYRHNYFHPALNWGGGFVEPTGATIMLVATTKMKTFRQTSILFSQTLT